MNDRFSLIYSPESIEDLRDIFAYISVTLSEPIIARKQVDRIRTAIKTLHQLPLRNPLVEWDPWLTMQMRKMLVDNYIVFYLVDTEKKTVSIIRILYGGRNLETILSV